MGVDLYTSFQKYSCFWLEKRGSTYTQIDLYTRKYGNSLDFFDVTLAKHLVVFLNSIFSFAGKQRRERKPSALVTMVTL